MAVPRTLAHVCLAAALLLGAGLLAAAGAAAHHDDGPHTVHLVAKTLELTTNSAGHGGAGDVYGFKDSLSSGGKRVGEDNCFCVAVDSDNLACSGILRLRHGSVTFTQPYRNSTMRGTGAITGGTGRYVGATGTFTAVGRKGTDPQVYDYTLRFAGGLGPAAAVAGDGGEG